MLGPDNLELDHLAAPSSPLVGNDGAIGKTGEKRVDRTFEFERAVPAFNDSVDVGAVQPELDRLGNKIDRIIHAIGLLQTGPSLSRKRRFATRVNRLPINNRCFGSVL
jgi:hypothetical protein